MAHGTAVHSSEQIVLLTAKIEAAYGTDSTPTPAANAVYARMVEVTPVINEVPLRRKRNRFTAPGVTIASAWYTVTIEVPVYGPTDIANDAPAVLALLQACGLESATDGPPITTYTLTRDSAAAQASVSLYAYFGPNDGGNWELVKILGAKGTATKVAGEGDELFWRFEMMGLYSIPTNVAAPDTAAFTDQDDHAPPRGHTLTVDSRTDAVSAFEIALNHTTTAARDQGATYGVAYIWRTHGQPTITHDAELTKTATYDRATKVFAETATSATLAINTILGVVYTWTMTNLQQGAWTYAPGEDVMRVAATLYPRDTEAGAGDDALTLTITAP